MAERLRACHCCGLVQQTPTLASGQRAYCCRCDTQIDSAHRSGRQSSARCMAAAVGSLTLYFPAILLPILDIEKLGHHHQTSLISGSVDLFKHGSYLVGVVVVLFSIILPLIKLLALIELSYVGLTHRKHRALTYRVVELAGRWSMMDVLLLSLLVALVKLGDLVEFHIGPAVIAFVGCVLMSMVASLAYDPHAIWEDGKAGAKKHVALGEEG